MNDEEKNELEKDGDGDEEDRVFDIGIVGGETELGQKLDRLISEKMGNTPSVADSDKKPELVAELCDIVFFTCGMELLRKLVDGMNKGPDQTGLWVYVGSPEIPASDIMKDLETGSVRVSVSLNPKKQDFLHGRNISIEVLREPDPALWVWLVNFLEIAKGDAGGRLTFSVMPHA